MAFKPQNNLTRSRFVHCRKDGQGGGREGQQAQGQTGSGQACCKPHVRRHSAAGDLIATLPPLLPNRLEASNPSQATLTEDNRGIGHQLHRNGQALQSRTRPSRSVGHQQLSAGEQQGWPAGNCMPTVSRASAHLCLPASLPALPCSPANHRTLRCSTLSPLPGRPTIESAMGVSSIRSMICV